MAIQAITSFLKDDQDNKALINYGRKDYGHKTQTEITALISGETVLVNIGDVVFNTTTNKQEQFNGTNWINFALTTDITGTNTGTNTGDETTLSIQTKRPLKTIEGQSLEGTGDIDLTKTDVGLSNVDNTSDIDKPVSTLQADADNLRLEKILNLSDVAIPNTALNNILPPQTSENGKILGTDGTNTLWVTPTGSVISEYGFVNLIGQSFTTNTFVNSTNGIYNIPSAGTWRLRYDISTDGSGVTVANSMVGIFDANDNIVTGSERARGSLNTVAADISAEVFVTTTSATTYTLKGRIGAATGSFGIINNASFDSTISWEKISGFISLSTFTGATQTVNGIGGIVPSPLATEQFKVLKANGTWSTKADAKIEFLSQIAAIATTTIFTCPQAGLYQIQITGSVVSPTGNRNVTAQTITHTEAGTLRTKAVGAGVNTNNLNNFSTITQVFQCDSGTNINYLNTMSGTTGSYNVRILITKLD